MTKKPRIITDPTTLETKDLKSASRSYVLNIVMKGLMIPERGHWIGALGLYKGEKCQAILNKTIETVRKALYPEGWKP